MTFIIKFSKILEVARKGNLVAGVAQVVERRIGSAEVTGPTPVASLYKLERKIGQMMAGLFYLIRNFFKISY